MLDINKWTESVKPFYEQSPQVFVTTLQFGKYKAELANVEELAIRLNKSGNERIWQLFIIPLTSGHMFNPVKCLRQLPICQLQKMFTI